MIAQPTCPPKSVWEKVVDTGFEDYFAGDWSAHLDGCSHCQTAVENLLGGQRTWLAIVAELRHKMPPASTICQKTLEGFKNRNPSSPFNANPAFAELQNPALPQYERTGGFMPKIEA
jgi:hypothetical protein